MDLSEGTALCGIIMGQLSGKIPTSWNTSLTTINNTNPGKNGRSYC